GRYAGDHDRAKSGSCLRVPSQSPRRPTCGGRSFPENEGELSHGQGAKAVGYLGRPDLANGHKGGKKRVRSCATRGHWHGAAGSRGSSNRSPWRRGRIRTSDPEESEIPEALN